MDLILLVIAVALVVVGGSFVAMYFLNRDIDQTGR